MMLANARAQSSAPQNRKVAIATNRRSQTAHAECERLRTRVGIRRTGRVDMTSARTEGRGQTDTGHVRSLHDNRATPARSVGSRILVAGLLPLPQLRSFCQGEESLLHVNPQLSAFWGKRHFRNAFRERIQLALRARPDLFQLGMSGSVCSSDSFTRERHERAS